MSKPETKCPTCGAEPGKSCRALTTGRVTDVHVARWESHFRGFRRRWLSAHIKPEEQA